MQNTISSAYRFRISFLSWWLVWSIVQAMVLLSYGASSLESITDSLVCNGLLAAGCLLIVNNMKYYLPQKERYWYILFMSTVISGIWLWLVKTILKLIFSASPVYLALIDNSLFIRFVIGFLMIGCMAVMSLLWYTLLEQQDISRRKEQAEQLTKDAELLQLRQQLQPHFLFNSLNSISALAGTQPEKARHMIQQLSDFLRGTLKKEDSQWVTFEEELRHLELYLDIEKVRFGQRLRTGITIANDVRHLKIPSLLLQPIVENAIKFGLYDTTGEVFIEIHAEMRQQQLEISISNPYDEETAVMIKGTGFGLASIQRRLYLLFARHDLISTSGVNGLFTTRLRIPQLTQPGK